MLLLKGLGEKTDTVSGMTRIALVKRVRKFVDSMSASAEQREEIVSKVVTAMEMIRMDLKDPKEESFLNSSKIVPMFSTVDDATNQFRREAKITGFIGHCNELGKLTYVSSMRQVNELEKKGFREHEVVSAIINA